VVLSSDDDDGTTRSPEHDAPIEWKVLVVDDAKGTGTTSAEALIPGLIGAGACGTPSPPAADRIPIIPPSGAHGQKCLRLAAKRSDLVSHVIR
jgi:hypothetical protein